MHRVAFPPIPARSSLIGLTTVPHLNQKPLHALNTRKTRRRVENALNSASPTDPVAIDSRSSLPLATAILSKGRYHYSNSPSSTRITFQSGEAQVSIRSTPYGLSNNCFEPPTPCYHFVLSTESPQSTAFCCWCCARRPGFPGSFTERTNVVQHESRISGRWTDDAARRFL